MFNGGFKNVFRVFNGGFGIVFLIAIWMVVLELYLECLMEFCVFERVKHKKKHLIKSFCKTNVGMALFYAHKLMLDLSAIINLTTTVAQLEANIHRVGKLLEIIMFIDHTDTNLTTPQRIDHHDLISLPLDETVKIFNSNELIVVNNLQLTLQSSDHNIMIGGNFTFTIKRYQSLGITGISGNENDFQNINKLKDQGKQRC